MPTLEDAPQCTRCGMAATEAVERRAPCVAGPNVRSISNELARRHFAPILAQIPRWPPEGA